MVNIVIIVTSMSYLFKLSISAQYPPDDDVMISSSKYCLILEKFGGITGNTSNTLSRYLKGMDGRD